MSRCGTRFFLWATTWINGNFAANGAGHTASFGHTHFATHFLAHGFEFRFADGAAFGVRNHSCFALFDNLTSRVRNFDSLTFFDPGAGGVRNSDSLALFDPGTGRFGNFLRATFFHPFAGGVRHFDCFALFDPSATRFRNFLGDGARNLFANRVRNFLVTDLLFVASATNRFLDHFGNPHFAANHFGLWSTTVSSDVTSISTFCRSGTAGIDRTRFHDGIPFTAANIDLFGVMNRLASRVTDIFVASFILIFVSGA